MDCFALEIIAGELAEIKPDSTDNKGNPYCHFIVNQTNPWNDSHVAQHWVKAWGASKMKDIKKIPIGSTIIVVAMGDPWGKDGQRANNQYQATKIIPVIIAGGGQSQGNRQPTYSNQNETHKETGNVEEVPF